MDNGFTRGRVSEAGLAFGPISRIVEREQLQQKPDNTVGTSVLWIDDRPDDNISERRAMEAYNVKFDLAKSTDEALIKLNKKRYDLIIGVTGTPLEPTGEYTLLRTLRSRKLTPYYIYTGPGETEEISKARTDGAQATTNTPTELNSRVLAVLESVSYPRVYFVADDAEFSSASELPASAMLQGDKVLLNQLFGVSKEAVPWDEITRASDDRTPQEHLFFFKWVEETKRIIGLCT